MILYDHECEICKSFILFLLRNKKYETSNCIGLNTAYGKKILIEHGFSDDYNQSVVYIFENKVFLKSNAVIKIVSRLGGVYNIAYLFKIIPGKKLDKLYDWFAKRRKCNVNNCFS